MLQEEIRTMRLAAGLTQKELAGLLFIEQNTLSQYETGERQMTLEFFEKVLSVLKVGVTFRVHNKDMKMKIIAKRFFDEWRSLEERFPDWYIRHSGGGIWIASRNIPNKQGKETFVSLSSQGTGIVYKRLVPSKEHGYEKTDDTVSFEEWKAEENLYEEYCFETETLIVEEREAGWCLFPEIHSIFDTDGIEEIIQILSELQR